MTHAMNRRASDRAIRSIIKNKTGDIDRKQTCRTLWAMFVSYSKYNGKPLKVFKSLGAICLLKRSLEMWKED